MLTRYFKSKFGDKKESIKETDDAKFKVGNSISIDLISFIPIDEKLTETSIKSKLDISFKVTERYKTYCAENELVSIYNKGDGYNLVEIASSELLLFMPIYSAVLSDAELEEWLGNRGHFYSDEFNLDDVSFEREWISEEPVYLKENNSESLNMLFSRSINDDINEFLLMTVNDGELFLSIGYNIKERCVTAEII
ncbi:MAG: hypothetical protein DRG78_04460 [Epsilonproteobacteria bacterium]|nr:MAG: hypothetical protein DRG78_04460 [Campylobacterota bacterium]